MTKDDAAASSVIDTTMRLPAISRAVANTPAKPPSVFAAIRGSFANAGPNGAFHSHQVSGT